MIILAVIFSPCCHGHQKSEVQGMRCIAEVTEVSTITEA